MLERIQVFPNKIYPWQLNLGCGGDIREGWLNIDSNPKCKPDLVMDITAPLGRFYGTPVWVGSVRGRGEFPIEEKSAASIEADNLLEHIGWAPNGEDLLMRVLNNCWTVLVDNGIMWFRVPDVESWPRGAFRDPTHRRYFCLGSIDYWDADHPTHINYGRAYGYLPWKIKEKAVVEGSGEARFIECVMTPAR